MAAGTVISGGFPGRVAREVYPNQKCSGCLHYDGQGGRTGVCTIGLRPDNCGQGEDPEVSYAPIARGAGSYLPDMGNHSARAPEVEPQHIGGLYGSGSTRPVRVQQVSLGEEQLQVVKSVLAKHSEIQKSQCLRCSMRGAHGVGPHNAGPQSCSCRPIEAETIAKAVINEMSNAERAQVSLAGVAEWIRSMVKASQGFRKPPTPLLDVPTSGARGYKKKPSKTVPAHDGSRVPAHPSRVTPKLDVNTSKGSTSIEDQLRIDDTGGHLRPISKGEGRGSS